MTPPILPCPEWSGSASNEAAGGDGPQVGAPESPWKSTSSGPPPVPYNPPRDWDAPAIILHARPYGEADAIATVELNRPEKANAMNLRMWLELREAFKWIDEEDAVRVAVLRGAGPCFTAGIDLELLGSVRQEIADQCDGRMREAL